MLTRRVPLAWHNLTHNPRRLAVAVAGIAFAVLLMFVQTGFQNALLDSTVKVLTDLDADIFLVHQAQFSLPSQQRFSRQRIVQARMAPGVQAVYPFYIQSIGSYLQTPGLKPYPIRVLAFHASDPLFLTCPGLSEHLPELTRPGVALMDSKSLRKYGVPLFDRDALHSHPVELANLKLQLIGTFELGTDFATDGNLVMTAENFARYFPHRALGNDPLGVVDLGIIKLTDTADARTVVAELKSILPNDVQVLTKAEFIAKERGFWNDSTPVGYMFTVGMLMGFVVGVIICYQIIHSDIVDHLAEFATLRAMGYPDRYFIGVVILESLYLSLFGFFPGLLASWALYQWLSDARGLLMILNLPRASFVLAMTITMCVISGCLVMRTVLKAEPAELF